MIAKIAGVDTNTAHTAYGIYSTVTNTNATSGTNIAGYFSASGATTANYALIVPSGTVGIGTTTPAAYSLDLRAYSAARLEANEGEIRVAQMTAPDGNGMTSSFFHQNRNGWAGNNNDAYSMANFWGGTNAITVLGDGFYSRLYV